MVILTGGAEAKKKLNKIEINKFNKLINRVNSLFTWLPDYLPDYPHTYLSHPQGDTPCTTPFRDLNICNGFFESIGCSLLGIVGRWIGDLAHL